MTDSPISNAAQAASSAYRLASLDEEFLLGDSTRGVRFQLEYQKAQEALLAYGIVSTLVVFGSARVRENGPGRQGFWYAQARAFGRIASLEGGALGGPPYANVVATGGGPGEATPTRRGGPRPSLTAQVRRRRTDQEFFLRLRDAIQQNHKALERMGT